ncbi:MAG: LLM class F420-dependent oxidoreductase [Deltaproteobacteria bacterium]|nr:LLM class F420-dependent oxidoreductase [Deltaproteobacteria bacterium]MBW2362288.1 LLM class F420-dependent oxidoreductase [Deltaproteobacteria bacterium]
MDLGKLAITLPQPGVSSRDSVGLAVKAEREWGYEAIWLAETQGPDSAALAGAIAQATERIGIGTAIVPVYNRTPAVLAMTAATLAELSADRFILGIGSSSHAIVESWNGVRFERPLAHVRDCVAILRQALAGEKTAYTGSALRSKGLRLGTRATPTKIYVAALREKMLETAGEIGDGLILNLFPPRALPDILAAYRRGAQRAGRDVSNHEVVCRLLLGVNDDLDSARNMVRMGFAGYFAQPVYNAYLRWYGFEKEAQALAEAFARGDRAGSAAALTDEVIDSIAVLGSEAQCRARIAEYVAGGVTTPVLAPLAGDLATADATFALFAPNRAG